MLMLLVGKSTFAGILLFILVSLFSTFVIQDILSAITYCWLFADGYDPLDPNGNIAITFDITQYTDDGYVVSTLFAYFY